MENSLLTQVFLPLALAFVMLGIGLGLKPGNFRHLLKFPWVITAGLAGQLLFMPALAFLLASILSLSPSLAVGVMLLAACPGGTTSNVMSQLLKADMALSVTLTALSTLICIVTTPVILGLSLWAFTGQDVGSIDVSGVTRGILIIALLPVMLGMFIRKAQPAIAIRLEPWCRRFSLIFLVLLVITILVTQWTILTRYGAFVIVCATILSFGSCLIGWSCGFISKANVRQARSLCIEVGIQNAALAIVIAISILQKPDYAAFAGIYGLVMYLAPVFILKMAMYSSRRSAKAQ